MHCRRSSRSELAGEGLVLAGLLLLAAFGVDCVLGCCVPTVADGVSGEFMMKTHYIIKARRGCFPKVACSEFAAEESSKRPIDVTCGNCKRTRRWRKALREHFNDVANGRD